MIKLFCIETENTDPWVNLAMEEHLTFREAEGQVILFLWQNAHTVVIGKNQDPWTQCRVETMKEEGCRLARRSSGGGAVYHDLGNLNFSFLARKEWFDKDRQTEVILRALQSLGIRAERNGRNDLTVEGKKFSGHAYTESGPFRCHHGTLMLEVDREKLGRYLQVSEEKLRSKGVDSVRSRVTNLRDYKPDLSLFELKRALKEAFGEVFEGEVIPMEEPRRGDPDLEKRVSKYSSEEWRWGRRIPFDAAYTSRFDWGEVRAELSVSGGEIRDCRIHSDALETEAFPRLEEVLKGQRYERKELQRLSRGFPTGSPERETLEMIAGQME